MNLQLLRKRTTDTSYPTDVALEKWFRKRGVPDGEQVPVVLTAAGSLGTTPALGLEYSPNGGASWNAALMSVSDTGASPMFYVPNNRKVRPTYTASGGTRLASLSISG